MGWISEGIWAMGWISEGIWVMGWIIEYMGDGLNK